MLNSISPMSISHQSLFPSTRSNQYIPYLGWYPLGSEQLPFLTLSILLIWLSSRRGNASLRLFQVQYTSLQMPRSKSRPSRSCLGNSCSAIATFPLDGPPGSSSLRPLQQSCQCKILHQYDSCYGSFNSSRYRTLGVPQYMRPGSIIRISTHHFAHIGP
jgi:hypothetical protein